MDCLTKDTNGAPVVLDLAPVSKCSDTDSPRQVESHTQTTSTNSSCAEGERPSETLDDSSEVTSNDIIVALHENLTCSSSETSQPKLPANPPPSNKYPITGPCESNNTESIESKTLPPKNSIDTTSNLNFESQLTEKVTSDVSQPVDNCKDLVSALKRKIISLHKNAVSDPLANTGVTVSSTGNIVVPITGNLSKQTQTTIINSNYTTVTSQSVLDSSIDLLDVRPPVFRQYKRKSAKNSVPPPSVTGLMLHASSVQGNKYCVDASNISNQTSIIDLNEDSCQNANVGSSNLESSSILENSTTNAHENMSIIAAENSNNPNENNPNSALHEIPVCETPIATTSEVLDVRIINPLKSVTHPHRKTIFLGPFESSSFAPFENSLGSSPLLKYGIPVIIESKQDELTVKPISAVECLTYVEIRPDLKEEIEVQIKNHLKESIQISKSEQTSKVKSEEIFVCTLCNKNFKLKSKYISHLEKHESTLSCFNCSKTFKRKEYLKQHLQSKHHLRKINEVSQPVPKDDGIHSAEKGSKRVLSCPVCNKECRSETNFNLHTNYHLGIRPEVCSHCGKRCVSKYNLNRHIDKVHKKIKPYTCSVCNKEFAWRTGFCNHLLLHSDTKAFKCAECGNCFRRKSHLKLHSRIHSMFTEFLCMYCGKQIKNKMQLTIHESSHEGRLLYECDLCKAKFKWPSDLSQHKRLIHLQKGDKKTVEGQKSSFIIRNYVKKSVACSFCGRLCSSIENLICHERIHKNEKPYSCTLCDKSFRGKYGLRRHIVVVHTDHRNLNKFICSFCDKKFISKISLSNHINTHTGTKPYGCEVCGKFFTQRGHLSTHLRIHRDLKQFSCSVCGRTFTTKGNLSQHEETHKTAPKRFPCKICNKTFLFNSRLQRHSKVHLTGGIQTMECDQSSSKAAK